MDVSWIGERPCSLQVCDDAASRSQTVIRPRWVSAPQLRERLCNDFVPHLARVFTVAWPRGGSLSAERACRSFVVVAVVLFVAVRAPLASFRTLLSTATSPSFLSDFLRRVRCFVDGPHRLPLSIVDSDARNADPRLSPISMTDDGHSVSHRGARRRPPRGPFIVTNPGDDDFDDGIERAPSRSGVWFPASSPTPRSPFSEQSPLPSSYTQSSSMPQHHQTSSVDQAMPPRKTPSNPSLSSPSGSSSPALESTPPPSTPGQSTAPMNFNGGIIYDDGLQVPDDASDLRNPAAGRPTFISDRVKQHIPQCLQPSRPSASRPNTVSVVLTIYCFSNN